MNTQEHTINKKGEETKMNIDYALIDELWGTSPVEWITYGELVDYIREAKASEPDWRPDQSVEEIARLAFNTMEDYLESNEEE